MASPNGTNAPGRSFDWHSFFLSLATAGTIACITFLITINTNVIKLQEHDLQQINYMNDNKQDINKMQLSIQEIRERTIRIESQQKLDQLPSK